MHMYKFVRQCGQTPLLGRPSPPQLSGGAGLSVMPTDTMPQPARTSSNPQTHDNRRS